MEQLTVLRNKGVGKVVIYFIRKQIFFIFFKKYHKVVIGGCCETLVAIKLNPSYTYPPEDAILRSISIPCSAAAPF